VVFIQLGQLKDIQKSFPEVKQEDCHIVVEFGNDRKTHFSGRFVVKIKNKGMYRFEDGRLLK